MPDDFPQRVFKLNQTVLLGRAEKFVNEME